MSANNFFKEVVIPFVYSLEIDKPPKIPTLVVKAHPVGPDGSNLLVYSVWNPWAGRWPRHPARGYSSLGLNAGGPQSTRSTAWLEPTVKVCSHTRGFWIDEAT